MTKILKVNNIGKIQRIYAIQYVRLHDCYYYWKFCKYHINGVLNYSQTLLPGFSGPKLDSLISVISETEASLGQLRKKPQLVFRFVIAEQVRIIKTKH